MGPPHSLSKMFPMLRSESRLIQTHNGHTETHSYISIKCGAKKTFRACIAMFFEAWPSTIGLIENVIIKYIALMNTHHIICMFFATKFAIQA